MASGGQGEHAPEASPAPEPSLNGSISKETASNAVFDDPGAGSQLEMVSSGAPDLTSRLISFFSTASNEMLLAVVIGLGACTYIFLGRIGLLLIGIITGIVIRSAWDGQDHFLDNGRRDRSLDIIKRLLDLHETQSKAKADMGTDEVEDFEPKGADFEDYPLHTGAALTAFVDTVIKDYVKWWYDPILPSEQSFPAACRRILTNFIHSISSHLSRKRPADTFLDLLTNSSSIVIVFFNELSSALSTSQGTQTPPENAIRKYLLDNPESSLANVLNQNQQKRKFHTIAEDILQNFLEKSAFDCRPVRTFLRELLAGVILEMSLQSFSRPEWLNGWIVYALEGSEPELMQAIDEGMNVVSSGSSIAHLTKITQENNGGLDDVKSRNRLSKAEEAMEEAKQEAKRLTQLMVEDDLKRLESDSAKIEASTDSLDKAESSSIDEHTTPSNLLSLNDGRGMHTYAATRDLHSSHIEQNHIGQNSSSALQNQIPRQSPGLQLDAQGDNKVLITFTLHSANVSILDDFSTNDRGRLRSKPSGDYLVQIEPQSSHYPGWMIIRKYTDFENLHEILRRIAAISGAATFTEQHSLLPSWKNHTRESLRGELEHYLQDACRYQSLAESEGLKRFLEKEQSLTSAGRGSFPGIGWPSPSAFENMGKGMLDVLANAPKGAAGGGKVVFGGVTGVLGTIGSKGQKKRDIVNMPGSLVGSQSQTFVHESRSSTTEPSSRASDEALTEETTQTELTTEVFVPDKDATNDFPTHDNYSVKAGSSLNETPRQVHDLESILLPPPPSEISDDYGSQLASAAKAVFKVDRSKENPSTMTSEPLLQSFEGLPPTNSEVTDNRSTQPARTVPHKEVQPLTEQEARVAVELLFAVINELYMLSSAWNIRRALLNAAKTFLLRPGNPSLSSIQSLMQDSVIAANISDQGIANHIQKLRQNSMPTEEELKAWPPELNADEKEKLRIKARRLLIEKGIPLALIGVMGQTATSEALGRVFDCLQVEEVARGLMFGLLLQGVRAVTQ